MAPPRIPKAPVFTTPGRKSKAEESKNRLSKEPKAKRRDSSGVAPARGAVTTLIVGAPRPAPVNQEKPLSKGKTFETLEKLLAEASSEADVDGFYESASD
jgi:hypothetical protein